MSTAIAKNFQIGADSTPSNNFTLYQPASPDGTLRLGNGNTGITSSLLTLTSAGNLGIGTSSPGYRLDVNGIINGNNSIISRRASGSQPEFVLTQTGVASWSIYNPPSSTDLRFYNGSDLLTMTSAGNLGLGVTPSAWESAYKAVQIGAGGSIAFGSSNAGAGFIGANVYADSAGTLRYLASSRLAARMGIDAGSFAWYTAPSGTAGNAISFTQAMTLDASGNLGVGTTSPAVRLHVANSGGDNVSYFERVGGSRVILYNASGDSYFGTTTNTPLRFATNDTERARIDSSGNLLVGTTNGTINSKIPRILAFQTASGPAISCYRNTTAATNQITFHNPNGEAGSINTENNATAYLTSSDYRLKKDVKPMTGALARVAALRPVTYKWKSDDSDGQGFIAHELQAVCPDAVSGEKDAVDAEGNPVYQGIDTSFLVATLTAAIQELNAKLEAQAAEIAALKGTA